MWDNNDVQGKTYLPASGAFKAPECLLYLFPEFVMTLTYTITWRRPAFLSVFVR